MKKFIIITFFNLIFISNVVNAVDSLFVDINNHWAEENILELAEKGIVSGYLDNTFKPENQITIMEFLKVLVEAGEYKLIRKGNCIYPDFYYETAISKGLISKDTDVKKNMTRYEMVEIISKFVDISNVKESKNKFKDLSEGNKSIVLKLVNLKVINGYKDKTFRGENDVTRAEAVTVITKVLEAREKIISNTKYDVRVENNLSNYLSDDKSLIKPFYEIKDDKILIYDLGRYAQLEGYAINSEVIQTDNIKQIIEKFINPNAYVAVLYIPSKYTINELKICYGKDEEKTLCGQYDFAFTYYENDTYQLATKSLNDVFSDNCYMRIDVIDLYDNDEINEFKKDKLLAALKIEFGNNASRILNFMLNESKSYENNIEREKEKLKKRSFGNYIVNYYQKENGIPQFYIERK